MAECGNCGSFDIKRLTMMATLPANTRSVYECTECGSVLEDKRDKFGGIIGETWKKPTQVDGISDSVQTDATKRRQAVVDEVLAATSEPWPLANCTDKVLEEIETAVELITEHPETVGLVKPLVNELFRELSSRAIKKFKQTEETTDGDE